MPKGYVISRVDVTDPEAYARYVEAGTKAIAAHGGRPLARGGRHEALDGKARARNVVIEFDSYEAARAYFYSAEYQAAQGLAPGRGGHGNGAGGGHLTWRRAIGSRTSRSRIPRATRNTSRRTPSHSPSSARASLCAAEATWWRRAWRKPGRWSSNSRTTRRRSLVSSSEEYKRAAEFRDAASLIDLIIVEGYDGPQPG